jgi:Beta-1,3-glucanase
MTGVLLASSLAALGLVLVPGCGSSGGGGGADAGHAAGAGSGAGAGAGGGQNSMGGGGAGQAGAGGSSTGGSSAGGSSAGGSSAGASGGAGSAGMMSGGAGAPPAAGTSGCGERPTEAQRKAPAFPASTVTNPTGVLFRFMNNCPTTIWIKAAPLPGGVVELPSKSTQDFDIGGNGIHGRVEAYRGAAPGSAGSIEAQFTEMNAQQGQALNVNLSHVDWVGLPVEVKGNASGKDCGVTACYQPMANLLNGCPAQLLDTKEGKCHAPNWYCGAHSAEPFCQALMASATNTLNTDPDCAVGKGTTFTPNDIFGCAAFFGGQGANKNGNACCAKVNRNWQQNATKQTPADRCSFYKTAAFNVYADWAQKQCPYIYAFAYDDVADQSGFFTCNQGTEMDVTYCPGDP